METTLELKDYITRADVNEAVVDGTMTEDQALDYVTDVVAHAYFEEANTDESADEGIAVA